MASEIVLRRHEFGKYRDQHKWMFFHIILGPEQCFHLKSIHLERDEWKVRYYDELIIRTFEQASLFVTLPPGIAVSQVLDKTELCDLREAFTYADLSQQIPEASTSFTGMKNQYSNAMPPSQFTNGSGMPSANNVPKHGPSAAAQQEKKSAYCPPLRSRHSKATPKKPVEDDMTPTHVNNPKEIEGKQKNHSQDIHECSEDAHMKCNIRERDSQANSTHATMHFSQKTDDASQTMPVANYILDKCVLVQRDNVQPCPNNIKADPKDLLSSNNDCPQSHNLTHNPHSDGATMGYPRLAPDHHTEHLNDTKDNADNAGYPRLISPLSASTATPLPIPTLAISNGTHSTAPADSLTNVTKTGHATISDQHDDPLRPTDPTEKKGCQSTRITNAPTANDDQTSVSIKDYLVRNAAFRPMDNDDTAHTEDDDVLFVKDTSSTKAPSIDDILLRSDRSGNLVSVCKEIISGWPNSFAHANSDYLAKLAACYSIDFPSYMCYAVTALRVLTHAPWKDNMFYGHIRELVLCAIGNGWTWADQTASVQGRRVSTAEICTALASYMD